MNDEQLEDLKQFIDSRISQSEAMTGDKLENFRNKLEELRKEMHEGFTGVGEAIEEINKQVDERLTKFEQHAV